MEENELPVCPECRMMPGSDTAVAQGCTCPVLDNGHGHSMWMTVAGDCAMHTPTYGADLGNPDGDR